LARKRWRAGGTKAIAPVFREFCELPDIALNDDGGGWCTDWYNGGAYGPPKWETFHIGQVFPWVDANLPTISTREGRAIIRCAGRDVGH